MKRSRTRAQGLAVAAMATAALVCGGVGVGCGSSDDSGNPGTNANDSGTVGDGSMLPPNTGMDAATGRNGDDASSTMDGSAIQDGATGTGDDGGDAGDGGLAGMFHRDYFDDEVTASVHSGASWYVGGSFTRISPHLAPDLAIVDATGGFASCAIGSGFTGGSVLAVATAGTTIFAAGDFKAYQGIAAPYLVKIDATTCALDRTFTPVASTGFNAAVYALAVVGTDLFVGGGFTTYRGGSYGHLAKLAIADGTPSATFSPPAANGVNGNVAAIASDGTSLYIGGSFGQALRGTATPANRIAKLDLTTGAADLTFSPATGGNGFDSQVTSLAIATAESSLYVGGFFSAYRGVVGSTSHLAKLALSTGALDTTFSPAGATANGTNGIVSALAVSSTSLYIGGQFTAYRGVAGSALDIAKLDLLTGGLDAPFSPPAANGFSGYVTALALSSGKLVVGGLFSTYRGVANVASSLAKLDALTGVLDTTFLPADSNVSGVGTAAGGDAQVFAIAPITTGATTSFVVGGAFASYAGVAANRIAKLDDRTFAVDTTFSPAAANGFDSHVLTLAASGTSIYAGGLFTGYRGVAQSAKRIAKLDAASGALDTTFSPSASNGFDTEVGALAVSGTSVYVGGNFTAYRGAAGSAKHLAKLDAASGALDTTFSPASTNGFDDEVETLVVAGTSLYAGGDFTAYRGVASSAEHLAKLDLTNGALDTTFSPPGSATSNGTNDAVTAVAVSDTSLYIGGDFVTYRGTAQAAVHIAKVDLASGVLDTTFNPSSIAAGFDDAVSTLAVTNGSVYVGGAFQSYRSSSNGPFYLAKLNATSGVADTTFSPTGAGLNGFDSKVSHLDVGNGVLLVGGEFTAYRGTSATFGLAVIDPTSGALN